MARGAANHEFVAEALESRGLARFSILAISVSIACSTMLGIGWRTVVRS